MEYSNQNIAKWNNEFQNQPPPSVQKIPKKNVSFNGGNKSIKNKKKNKLNTSTSGRKNKSTSNRSKTIKHINKKIHKYTISLR